jgi:hypothetical protein
MGDRDDRKSMGLFQIQVYRSSSGHLVRTEMGRVKYQDDQEIREVIVHKINMGDVEDPDLMVAEPIWQWQQTPAGKFVMENAVIKPMWRRVPNPMTWGHTYVIIAELEAKKLTEFYLRWGKTDV